MEKLKRHLESYRRNLKVTCNKEIPEYSKTFRDHATHLKSDIVLKNLIGKMMAAASNNTVSDYRKALFQHRDLLFYLHESFALKMFDKNNALKDPNYVLNFAKEVGWHWFKFAPIYLEMSLRREGKEIPYIIIPNYSKKFKHSWDRDDVVVLDADEAKLACESTFDFFEIKLKNPGYKMRKTDVGPGFTKIEEFNSETDVLDWTLPMFGVYL